MKPTAQSEAAPALHPDAWRAAFVEALIQLRPYLTSRVGWLTARMAYPSLGGLRPADAAARWHAANPRKA